MEDLAARIMRVFAVALKLPADFFNPFISAPVSALRALNYPTLSTPTKPGQIRAGAHTDYGSLTILLPQADSRGLEILSPNGSWVEVPPHENSFVINIGDLMARWTNDRWVSTVHRVVMPSADSHSRSFINQIGTRKYPQLMPVSSKERARSTLQFILVLT
jgi:isopenicillin N synthase-like dioxygenase